MFKGFKGVRRLRLMAVGAVFFAAVSAAVAQSAADVRLDVDLKDADMMYATRMLFQRTGVQFVIKPSSKAYSRITLRLKDVTAEEAIKYICQAAGAYYTRDELGVYTISQEAPAPPAPEVVPPAKKKPPVVRRIKIAQADAQAVYHSIVRGLPMDGGELGWERLKKITNLSQGEKASIFGESYARTGRAQPMFSIGMNGGMQQIPTGANPVATDLGNDIQLPGESARQIGGGRGGGGFGGQGGGGGLGGGGQGAGGGGLGGGQGNTTLTAGEGLVPEGVTFISYDPNTNSLIVEADDDEAVNRLREAIAFFDVAPRQVQIKVEFISVAEGFTRNLGFEFLFQRGAVFAGETPGSFAPAGPIFFNYQTGNLAFRLRAGLTQNNSKVENAPIVRTLNNTPAAVFATVTQPVFVPTTIVGGLGGGATTYQLIPVTAGTTLSVAPRINQDDMVTMFLQPQVGGFQGTASSPDGSQIAPILFQQGIQVVARVRNNETIVLGGLTTKNDTTDTRRVPVLSELPIIGQFFRSTSRNQVNSQLLIFVTPTIIPDETSQGTGP